MPNGWVEGWGFEVESLVELFVDLHAEILVDLEDHGGTKHCLLIGDF